MRVLITGGTGHLGRVLVSRCAARGDDVHASWHTRPAARDGPVAWHRADLLEPDATRRLIEQVRPEVVFHTAYAMTDLEQVITAASGTIAAACFAAGARLVHLSTDVVFDGRTDRPYREDDGTHPITAYGRAKEGAEQLVRAADPTALVVRTSLIYGGSEPGPQEALVGRALDEGDPELVFFTDEIRSYVHVDDLAGALLELAPLPISGVLHVAGPDAVSRYEFAVLLARSWGRTAHDGLRAGTSAGLDPPRPQNCTLDSSAAARSLTATRLRGAREVLEVPGR